LKPPGSCSLTLKRDYVREERRECYLISRLGTKLIGKNGVPPDRRVVTCGDKHIPAPATTYRGKGGVRIYA